MRRTRQAVVFSNEVVAIVRASNTLTRAIGAQPNLQEVEASISGMSENDLTRYLEECDAVLSCLGHNLTLQISCQDWS